MLKPYLYGGLALLIVGLFCFMGYQAHKVSTLTEQLTEARQANVTLANENKDLLASSARKAGAAAAYSAMTEYVAELTKNATGIIRGYRARETENAKCLDMRPPTDLLERLRENGVRGQNHKGTSK